MVDKFYGYTTGTLTSTSNALGASHISSTLQNYEAARSGFFVLKVHDLAGIPKATFSGELGAAAATDTLNESAEEIIELNVIKAPVPHFSVEPLEYRRGNEVVKFAGVPKWESGEIVVDDIVGVNTKGILMAWQQLVYNTHTKKGGRMADYKKECDLIEYTQDYEAIRTWKLHGCWISDFAEDTFDRENDGKRQIRITIQYDRADYTENMAFAEYTSSTSNSATE